jgi:hypothetical protein
MANELDETKSDYENMHDQEESVKNSKPIKKLSLIDEGLKARFIQQANDFENYAIDAVKEGKISLDNFHQMSLLAMMCINGDAKPEYGHCQALAFALGFTRACGSLMQQGIMDEDMDICFRLLRMGNVSLGVAKRIEIEQELKKQNAKKAAHVRHSPNLVYKELVWDYYKEGIQTFKSRDQAAEKISSKPNIPFAFRTVRKWIDEFHKAQKNLPSA